MNLGVDFGSTYTTLSYYASAAGQLQDISLYEGAPYIPTLVSEGKGKLQYGSEARTKTGKTGFRTYKAFKMLLPETDEKRLAERGYDASHTPKDITEKLK